MYLLVFCFYLRIYFSSLTEKIFLFFIHLIHIYGASLKCQALLNSRYVIVKTVNGPSFLKFILYQERQKGVMCKKDETT